MILSVPHSIVMDLNNVMSQLMHKCYSNYFLCSLFSYNKIAYILYITKPMLNVEFLYHIACTYHKLPKYFFVHGGLDKL